MNCSILTEQSQTGSIPKRFVLHNILLNASILSIFIILLFLATSQPRMADDFSYANTLHKYGPAGLIAHEYMTWSGRVLNSILMVFNGLSSKTYFIFGLLNGVGYVALIYLIMCCGLRRQPCITDGDKSLYVILLAAVAFSIPFAECVFWHPGAASYLWPLVLSLAFFKPYIFWLNESKAAQPDRQPAMKSPFIFTAGFIAASAHEQAIASMFAMLLCCAFWTFTSKRGASIPRHLLWGVAGFSLGALLLIGAPGNFARLQVVHSANQSHSLSLSGYFWLIVGILTSPQAHHFRIWGLLLFLAACLSFIHQYASGDTPTLAQWNMKKIFAGIWVMVAVFSIAPALLTGGFAIRTITYPIVFLVIAILSLFPDSRYIDRFAAHPLAMAGIGIIALCVLLNFGIGARYRLKTLAFLDHRMQTISALKQSGKCDIVVTPIDKRSRWSYLTFESDVSADRTFWINQEYARYFGLHSVTLQKTGEQQ